MVNIKKILEDAAKSWNVRYSQYRAKCYAFQHQHGYLPDYMEEHLGYLADKTHEYMSRAEAEA